MAVEKQEKAPPSLSSRFTQEAGLLTVTLRSAGTTEEFARAPTSTVFMRSAASHF